MTLIEADRAARRCTTRWAPAIELSGGSAANTMAGVASFGGRAALHRQGRRRRARRRVPPRPPRRRRAVPTTRRDRRGAHRPLPHRRHARRPAHDEHLPRVCRRCSCPDDVDDDARGRGPRSSTWRATCSTAPRPRRPSAGRPRSPTPPGGKVSLTLSDSFCVDRHRDDFRDARRRPGRPPVRQRGRAAALYEVDDFDDGAAPRSAATASRRGHPRRDGLGRRDAPTRSSRSPPQPVDRGGRHDRRRRPVRRRLPLRPHPRAVAGRVRAARARSPRPRSSATSAPARSCRSVASRDGSARCCRFA